jgi:hypothetical protein
MGDLGIDGIITLRSFLQEIVREAVVYNLSGSV